MILQGIGLDQIARPHPGKAIIQRHPGAGDRRGAGAAIRLQHIAIDDDLPFADRR